MIFYLDIIALSIFFSSAFISRLLWMQYQSLKLMLAQSAALQVEIFTSKSMTNFKETPNNITGGKAAINQSLYQVNTSSRAQSYLKTSILTASLAIVALSYMLIMMGVLDRLLSHRNLTVQAEFQANPNVYQVNNDIAGIATAFFLLEIVAVCNMWLPANPAKGQEVFEESSEDGEIKVGYFPLPKCCIQMLIRYLMSR
jgi:hypothetical protein